jgi:hypothetical protein
MEHETSSSLPKLGIGPDEDVDHRGVDELRFHQGDDDARPLPGAIGECVRKRGPAGDVVLATKPQHDNVTAPLGVDRSWLKLHLFLPPARRNGLVRVRAEARSRVLGSSLPPAGMSQNPGRD